jgi:hypothetical protein
MENRKCPAARHQHISPPMNKTDSGKQVQRGNAHAAGQVNKRHQNFGEMKGYLASKEPEPPK